MGICCFKAPRPRPLDTNDEGHVLRTSAFLVVGKLILKLQLDLCQVEPGKQTMVGRHAALRIVLHLRNEKSHGCDHSAEIVIILA